MAATITWTGNTSNDATVASNWFDDMLPVPGDTVILPGTATSSGTIDFAGQPGTPLAVPTVTIDAAATANAINFTDAAISGGTITSASGTAAGAFSLNLTDSTADEISWFLGDFATLDLTGSTPSSMQITSNGNNELIIKQAGTNDRLTVNTVGTVSTDVELWLSAGGIPR